ncbi:MAG: GTP cyclohydrolase I FolE [Gemmatimonadetes bacterium]|nr:GTP cyclohydrolase I FolE [Gemmatimonadota bacterium]
MIANGLLRAVPNGRPAVGRREVDPARVEAGVREMLLGLGEDPDREGLLETPARVARAFAELTFGASELAEDHLSRVFAQDHAGDDVVMLKGIRFVSLCEHHLLPFTGVAHVAYLPSHGRVAGLSKLARTVDVFARRLQMQERLTAEIANAMQEHLDPRGVAVVVEAEHSCLRLRGARKEDAHMVTTAFRGALEGDRGLRAEVLSLMGVGAMR